MRLYSVQPRFVYDTLCRDGVFLAKPLLAGADWFWADSPGSQLAYAWLCAEMSKRGMKRPAPDVYPVWAWFQYLGPDRPKPDLRCREMKHEAAAGCHVLFSLDIPDQHVLLHDFHAWHYPLNYWYLATQREGARFERRCRDAKSPLYGDGDVPLADALLHDELQRSWQGIFDLPGCRRRLQISAASQVVQATFWELRSSDVIAATEFGHGMRRTRLPLP